MIVSRETSTRSAGLRTAFVLVSVQTVSCCEMRAPCVMCATGLSFLFTVFFFLYNAFRFLEDVVETKRDRRQRDALSVGFNPPPPTGKITSPPLGDGILRQHRSQGSISNW